MYDSRSDHPHKGLHMRRYLRDQRSGGVPGVDGGGWRDRQIDAQITDAQAIAEGLSDYLDEQADEQVEPIDCEVVEHDFLADTFADIQIPVRTKRTRGPKEAKKMNTPAHLTPKSGSVPLVGANAKRRTAKQPFSRLSDGQKHPVTVTTKRERALEQAAEVLSTVVVAALDADQPAKSTHVHA